MSEVKLVSSSTQMAVKSASIMTMVMVVMVLMLAETATSDGCDDCNRKCAKKCYIRGQWDFECLNHCVTKCFQSPVCNGTHSLPAGSFSSYILVVYEYSKQVFCNIIHRHSFTLISGVNRDGNRGSGGIQGIN